MRIPSVRIGAALAAIALTGVAALTATPAQATTAGLRVCTFEATLDFASDLSAITSVKHVIGSGRLTHCTDGASGDFRIVGDGPANCVGQGFVLYQEIYWEDGQYSFIKLVAPSLLGIGVHAGEVLDYAYAGSHVKIASLPHTGFLLQCLTRGVHRVSFVGTETIA